MESRSPYLLDTSGQDVHAEATRLQDIGAIARVDLPGGVLAWSATTYAVAGQDLEPQGTFIMNGHARLPVRLGTPAERIYRPADEVVG
jgi:hypothetical protein